MSQPQPQPGPTSAASADTFTVTARDGFALAARRWLPAGKPRAVLQLAHGMSEHKDRYAAFAEACTAAGLAVYAHDHRGHGQSTDSSTPLGHYADHGGWDKVVGDVGTVQQQARREHPGAPVFLFGHSMGSFIARAYLVAQGASLAGAIISATGFRFGVGNRVLENIALVETLRVGARTPSALMGKLVFGSFNLRFRPARTAFDWLSRDPAEVDKYVADPRCGFDCGAQLWRDLMAGVYALERAEARPELLPRVPLFAVAGSHDPVSMGGLGSRQLVACYRRAGNADATERRYPGGRHELINETNRAEVWRDIIGWIEQRA